MHNHLLQLCLHGCFTVGDDSTLADISRPCFKDKHSVEFCQAISVHTSGGGGCLNRDLTNSADKHSIFTYYYIVEHIYTNTPSVPTDASLSKQTSKPAPHPAPCSRGWSWLEPPHGHHPGLRRSHRHARRCGSR